MPRRTDIKPASGNPKTNWRICGHPVNFFVLLFSFTLCLSASLTFVMQPMIGKMLLPLVGGAPSGWLVTMVYFQIALLTGYAVAHLLSRVPAQRHVAIVCVLLLGGLFMLPLHLDENLLESSGLPEAVNVFLTLAFGLTLPCIALFSLSPSLQRLFDAGSAQRARDPYFLFAASNIGSLGGLLAYPFFIEQISGLSAQTRTWQAAYVILILLCLLCLLLVRRNNGAAAKAKNRDKIKTAPLTWRRRFYWLLLAFIPSSLMLGITALVTADTGSMPLFWVLPLALYLLTFILAFARADAHNIQRVAFVQALSVTLLIVYIIINPLILDPRLSHTAFPFIAFFLTALFCHFTLAASRPPAPRLTEFYLWVAIGGALGGIFNTFVAPFLFAYPIEFRIVLLLSCLLYPLKAQPPAQRKAFIWAAVIGALAVIITCAFLHKDPDLLAKNHKAVFFELAGLILLPSLWIILSRQPRLLALIGLVGFFSYVIGGQDNVLTVERNFFGILRIYDREAENITVRYFQHGNTTHGAEQVAPFIDTTPGEYYYPEGTFGDVFAQTKPADVGVVGFGAGALLCFKAPNRHFTYYEIDPAVVAAALKWFDFARNCGMPDIRIGDGRRQLALAQDTRHDLLVVDAFTSDLIPVHLLTREAFELYFNRLKPGGVLAIHISNRFFDLRFPISGVVKSLGLHALYKIHYPPPSIRKTINVMAVVARDEKTLEPFRKRGWSDLPVSSDRLWTDDYSNPLSALKLMHYRDKPV